MKKLFPILILFFPSLAGLWARPKTDVLVMNNGDRFTCEIKKLDRGVLYASLDYVDGTVSLQWSKVARVESTQLFVVHTQSGVVYEGTLRTPATSNDQPVQIEVLEISQNTETLPQREVVEMAQTSQSFWKRISGSIDSGLIYTKGNDTTQYNIAANALINRDRWSARSNLASTLSKSSGVTASTHNQAELRGLRRVGRENWFYSGGVQLLQSSQQGIDIQSTLGLTGGKFLKDTNNARILLSGGLAWQQTRYQESAQSQDAPNALAGMVVGELHLFKFKKTALDVTASLLPELTQPGRVRTYVNSAYSIQIISNLWLKFSFYGNWDNRPPGTFSGSDFGTSTNISWSFN